MLNRELDENLMHARTTLSTELAKRDILPPYLHLMEEIIEIRPALQKIEADLFKDTMRWYAPEEEFEPFRQYLYTEEIRGKQYRITLNHSKIESAELFVSILWPILLLLTFFVLMINLFNYFISQMLWEPFYQMIRQIRLFNFSDSKAFQHVPSPIDEFEELDLVLQQMTAKSLADFRALKQFTENASHEMQTPLAIIRSQIELLMQQDISDPKELQRLSQIQQAASRLSKLNQALSLLTRIENRQFKQLEKVGIHDVILEKIAALQIMIDDKSLTLLKDIKPVSLMADPLLVDILVSNLLTNAIKHNQVNGTISISLYSDKMEIENTGKPLLVETAVLFQRFTKADNSASSLGLGLAIVKEICNKYRWRSEYASEGKTHTIQVYFNP